ncbi:MAG TPA: hypothetical protein VFB58_03080 [Chloroflexota bacterium]|nr:hypothetical protein [Chloroflexota bacterium]
MRAPLRLVPLLAIALLAIVALPYHAVQAQSGLVGAGTLSNPFILTNPTTGAQVQIMPTTAYLAQHAPPPSTSSGSTTTPPYGTLPSPTCTLGVDSSNGDAHVLVNTADTQFDSLDLSAFGLSSDTSNVTGVISAQSLSDGTPVNGTPAPATPQVAGGGDIWYVVWNYGNTPGIKGYFLEAQYPGTPADTGYTDNASTSNLPVDFTYGTIVTSATGGDQFTTGGAATGNFDTTNNRISITAPLSAVGSPAAGATLSSPYADGDALVGTPASGGLLETADTLTSSSNDYQVGNGGTACPSPRTGQVTPGLPSTGSTNNLAYYGGPVVHSIHNYLIWWLPKAGTTTYSNGSACTEPATASYSFEQPASGTATVGALPGGPDGDIDYQTIIQQYFKDLNGTQFYNLLSQYADEETGATQNSESLAGTWTDNCGYTSTPSTTTGPVPGGTDVAPIYQTDIQAEVQRAIAVNHWPEGLGNEYFVYTGYGATDCFAPPGQASAVPTCDVAFPPAVAVGGYCAYHGDFMQPDGNYVLYADMADGAFAANPSSINMCYTSPIGVSDPTHTVNGNQVTDPIADAEVSITSHEEFETVSDSEVGTAQQLAPPLAWYDAVNGEIGDKCAYNYGNYAADGSNIVLHGDHYIVQQEYSNWNNGCALTSYQGNGGYGGDSAAVTIQKGTTLIGVPVSGITNTEQLVSAMESPGNLPSGAITRIQLYKNGAYQTYYPGHGKGLPLSRTDGILVFSNTSGTWHPSGTLYTSAPTIQLQQGWNLVSATYPNPGLMTDAIYNQIAAENNACSAGILTNTPCSQTITEIKAIGPNGLTIDWKPAPADSSGNATWPQTYGNQIPFTSGMWIYAAKPLTWTVQGAQCQTVDSSGNCG